VITYILNRPSSMEYYCSLIYYDNLHSTLQGIYLLRGAPT